MIIKLEKMFSSDKTTESFKDIVEISNENFKKFLIKKFKPCDVEVRVYSINDSYFIDFSYELDVIYKCSRCLTDVEKHISNSFSREILFTGEKFGEDEGVLIVENNEINVKEILLESIYLTLETNIICKDDCKGLCPKCGINLNKDSCDCDLNDINPRFAKLKGLKDKLKN